MKTRMDLSRQLTARYYFIQRAILLPIQKFVALGSYAQYMDLEPQTLREALIKSLSASADEFLFIARKATRGLIALNRRKLDEAMNKNSCKRRFCDLISASLGRLPAGKVTLLLPG